MTDLIQVKTNYIVAMKRLKLVVATRAWCCEKHEKQADESIARFSSVKNACMVAHRDGAIGDDVFAKLINFGTETVNRFASALESHLMSKEEAETYGSNMIIQNCPGGDA